MVDLDPDESRLTRFSGTPSLQDCVKAEPFSKGGLAAE